MKKLWNYISIYLLIGLKLSARAGGAGGKKKSSGSSYKSTSGTSTNKSKSTSSTTTKKYDSSSNSSKTSTTTSTGSSHRTTYQHDDFGSEFVTFIVVAVFAIWLVSLTKKSEENIKVAEEIKDKLKDFNKKEFLKRVEETFVRIQRGWEAQSLIGVRNLISDGVYQKFNTQILMMKSLKQYNIIEYLRVMDTKIVGIEVDGAYDIVHVEIKASINEKFVSMIDSSLNENIEETFKEYWSFIRKKSHSNGNLLDSNICPSCGAQLEDVEDIEVAKCQYCNSILNTGEYDWVLSEITQRSIDISIGMNRRKELTEKFQEMFGRGVDFSKQLLEDKVSNGVVQIDKAIALNKPYLAKRFVTDEIYEQIATNKEGYIFNRYYTTDCGLYVIDEDKENYYVKVNVEREYQRVRLIDNKIVPIDTDFKKKTARVKLMKKKEESEIKGSIYANQCAVCGGALEDTIDTHCPYCGEVIADPRYDWIIYEIEGLIE